MTLGQSKLSRKTAWLINHYVHLPHEDSGLTRHFELAKRLQGHGWNLILIGASTEHPSGRNRIQWWHQAQVLEQEGVSVVWVPTTGYRANGIDRMLNMLIFSVRVLLFALTRRVPHPDLVIGSCPHTLGAISALIVAKLRRVPFVYEIRDLWPQALIDMGWLAEASWKARLMRWMERQLFSGAEAIIALWPQINIYAEERGLAVKRYHWVSNGFDPTAFAQTEAPKSDPDTFTFMYFGAHGGANDLETAVRAMALVKNVHHRTDIVLRLIGDGPHKPALIKLAHELVATNVVFEERVPKSEIPKLSTQADAFLFILKKLDMFRYGISPNKLFEFMAARRAIVFCSNSKDNPVSASGGGLVVDAGNPANLAKMLVAMADSTPEARSRMAEAGYQYVLARHDWAHLAHRFATALNDVPRPRYP